MKTLNTFKIVAILLIMVGGLSACKDKDTTTVVTGTIMGSYGNGFTSILVQIDGKYSIGETLEYADQPCLSLPQYGTYKNMVQVQPFTDLLSDWSEGETLINKRISFSYRAYNYGEEDVALFGNGIGNAFCVRPDVPVYVITDCQILK